MDEKVATLSRAFGGIPGGDVACVLSRLGTPSRRVRSCQGKKLLAGEQKFKINRPIAIPSQKVWMRGGEFGKEWTGRA